MLLYQLVWMEIKSLRFREERKFSFCESRGMLEMRCPLFSSSRSGANLIGLQAVGEKAFYDVFPSALGDLI